MDNKVVFQCHRHPDLLLEEDGMRVVCWQGEQPAILQGWNAPGASPSLYHKNHDGTSTGQPDIRPYTVDPEGKLTEVPFGQ